MQQEIFEMPRQDIDSNHGLEATGMSAPVLSPEQLAVFGRGLPVPQPYRWRALGMRRVVLL